MLWSASNKKLVPGFGPIAWNGNISDGHSRGCCSPLSDFDHRAQLHRAVIASTVGTTIEGTISCWRHWSSRSCSFRRPDADWHLAAVRRFRAGARTGKTKVLAHRVAHLLMNGCDPQRLLLLNFTVARRSK
jgi:hypothetical protein